MIFPIGINFFHYILIEINIILSILQHKTVHIEVTNGNREHESAIFRFSSCGWSTLNWPMKNSLCLLSSLSFIDFFLFFSLFLTHSRVHSSFFTIKVSCSIHLFVKSSLHRISFKWVDRPSFFPCSLTLASIFFKIHTFPAPCSVTTNMLPDVNQIGTIRLDVKSDAPVHGGQVRKNSNWLHHCLSVHGYRIALTCSSF